MTPEQARVLFNEHREPGDLAHYGEKAAVAAILATTKAEHEVRMALIRYMAAVRALGTKSTVDPSRIMFDERPMSDAGLVAWQELDAAGKQAAAALADPQVLA